MQILELSNEEALLLKALFKRPPNQTWDSIYRKLHGMGVPSDHLSGEFFTIKGEPLSCDVKEGVIKMATEADDAVRMVTSATADVQASNRRLRSQLDVVMTLCADVLVTLNQQD